MSRMAFLPADTSFVIYQIGKEYRLNKYTLGPMDKILQAFHKPGFEGAS